MIVSTPPPPPIVEQPASHEVSYGAVRGRAAAGATRLIVEVDGEVAARLKLRSRVFGLDLDLPTGERTIRVSTLDGTGRRASTTVTHVFGLPRAARPRGRTPRLDPLLQRDVRALVGRYGGTAGIYLQSLTTGAGAAWNATATFPAASTLKLAIGVTALTRLDGPPAHGSSLDRLFRSMLTVSDNGAANAIERVFGGSTSGGSALVNETMRSIGLERTEMYGGYVIGTERDPSRALAAAIPLAAVDQPAWGRGKQTTAYDLSRLLRAVWLASAGKGPLRTSRSGLSPREARYLLYLLARVRDPGKLDRRVGALPGVAVLHKAGWIKSARHDNGLVFWRGGVFVVTVMTHGSSGRADALAGDVATTGLRRFRG